MHPFIWLGAQAVAFIICWAFLFVELKRDPKPTVIALSLGAAVASVFPPISMAVAAAIVVHWLVRRWRNIRLTALHRHWEG